MKKSIITFFLGFFCVFVTYSQTVIKIESQEYALVFQTDENKRLRQVYFGQRLTNENEYKAISQQLQYNGNNEDVFNHVYTPSGTWNIAEPALEIEHSDGNLSTELEYVGHAIQNIEQNVLLTTIDLFDPVYKTEVRLFFKTYQSQNVFEQWVNIKNGENKPIELKKFASSQLYFRNDDFYLTQYHGSWAEEMQPETHRLTSGIKTLDSKLGTRANLYAPPSFMLSFNEKAKEDNGKVLLANLAWSGNFRFDFEKDRYNNLRLIAGANNFASSYKLRSGASFETPHFIYTYSEKGKGDASRNMHDWARTYKIVDGLGERLTLLNNWEATYFDFNENKITSLFKGASELGVDLFLLDDGWFANKYPRNSDKSGLGDWQENKIKLPHGLGHLVKEASKEGVKFGIWIEPEMVNPKSELYENHRDWVIRQPNRKEYYYRNQLVLDLSNPDVQEHVFKVFDNLLTQYPKIAYVKWDANSIIYNAHSEYLNKEELPQSHLYIDYVKGLYKVLQEVRGKYPKLPIMLCSGGGGRVDYGALQYFTEFWPSDNTAPRDRVFMHWEYSHFFPSIAMSAHVTNWDKNASIKYRTDVASMGKLGFDIVVDELSEDDRAFCKAAVSNYDSFKELVWHGNLYRLQSPYAHSYASFQYVNQEKNKSVVFSYLVSNRFQVNYSPEPIVLNGLNSKKKYRIKELNLYPNTTSTLNENEVYTGDYLMKVGINPDITIARKSVIYELTALD